MKESLSEAVRIAEQAWLAKGPLTCAMTGVADNVNRDDATAATGAMARPCAQATGQ
jgi:nuclear transport factor 2 (NTF2) superfamily protein